ncbi:hypothetical protein FRC06_002251 [Ceratobasidium sp. 370]|nr:hypothetical protein FRC06_002251 [Ceratobasidium sp. 370]
MSRSASPERNINLRQDNQEDAPDAGQETAIRNEELGGQEQLGMCSAYTQALSVVLNSLNDLLPDEEGTISIRFRPRPGRIDQHGHTSLARLKNVLSSRSAAVPWWPFQTHADFRFARLTLDAGMNARQINEDLEIHHLASDCQLTFKSADEVRRVQARAEHLLAPYQAIDYSVPLRATNPNNCVDFTVWIMPLVDWILELVQNLEIQKDLHFDSVQKFRMTDGKWMLCVDEPWTTDDWASVQAMLPEGGLPISIILYADKALASSWGTKKLYPIIARLGNLPRTVRNGNGVGAGRVVGLLPVVDEAPPGLGTTVFANFKCNVWHCGMEKLLDTIRMEARVRYAVELELHRALNLERKTWRLFPNIPIVCADLEEQ